MLTNANPMEVAVPLASSAVFEAMEEHERVVYFYDKLTGLKAIVAIHDTTLGPAVGGTRVWAYRREEDALRDVLRLSRGMTYKSSLAGLNFGGGKAVIIGDTRKIKTEALLRMYGRYLNSLGGSYWTAEDMNMSTEDMRYINMETKYVLGLPEDLGGSGDPSPATAYGVYVAAKASCKKCYGSDSLTGKHVVLQGLGKVGMEMLVHLTKERAIVWVYDIDEKKVREAVQKYKVTPITNEQEVFEAQADIFMPCAMGGILNEQTISKMHYKIIAGSANNQLAAEPHAALLRKRGILYAPDFLINAGGIINVYYEYQQRYSAVLSRQHLARTYGTLKNIYALSDKEDISTHDAAMRIAHDRIVQMRRIAHK